MSTVRQPTNIPLYWETLRYFDPLIRDADRYSITCKKGKKEWEYAVSYDGSIMNVRFDVSGELPNVVEVRRSDLLRSFYKYGVVISVVLAGASIFFGVLFSPLISLVSLVPLSVTIGVMFAARKLIGAT